eukprot:1540677-Pyramimonas_sp.AAC.1
MMTERDALPGTPRSASGPLRRARHDWRRAPATTGRSWSGHPQRLLRRPVNTAASSTMPNFCSPAP